MSAPRIVFADFDGTITADETFVSVLKHFAPTLAADLVPRMLALEVPLRVGVRRILESIPSERLPDIVDHVRRARLRPGFTALLDMLDARGVPLVIVSGGLVDVVHGVLGPLAARAQAVHGVRVDTDGPTLRVHTDWEGETELVSKVDVIRSYGDVEAVGIGDSVTDLNMALHVPVIFARDRLAELLGERRRPFEPWGDFFDVARRLGALWAGGAT